MAKLFLFAIGGTGSRVVKALSMLLASGVEVKNTDTIVPIIIDPDSANGDLTRTVEILKTYREIRDKAKSDKMGFFKTELLSLDALGDGGNFVSDNFKFDIDGVKEQLFKEFIGYSEMDRSNRAFASLLFSKQNLDADMEVGFKGNPNIGSVVLNKFKDSSFFRKFASNFAAGDRVFIISSIFGGTGAAGFPLILKNIRNAQLPTPNHKSLQNARIGAVTLLPYFKVEPNEDTTIDSNTFIAKTKAALSYYARNVSGNSSINALYYIGDKVTTEQKGADGAYEQKNKAHFIELAAALSIVDFMSLGDGDLAVADGVALNPKYFEFGLGKEAGNITFHDLAKETFEEIARPITQYSLFKAFIDAHYDEYAPKSGQSWASNGNNKLNKNGVEGRYLNSLRLFNKHYNEWLSEMANSEVGFNAIDNTKTDKDIYNLVNGMPSKKSWFEKLRDASGLDHYLGALSKAEPSFDYLQSNKKLMALFYNATKDIVEKEIKIKN